MKIQNIFMKTKCKCKSSLDQELNVISVEWSELAKGPEYHPAAQNTQEVRTNICIHITLLEFKFMSF